jgi:hypothetical protein
VVLREKIAPGPGPPFGDLVQGAFLLAPFMALFHKQNSAGENPFVRRVAQRGGGLCKTRLRGFKSRRNNFKFYTWFTRLPVYPNSRARAGRRAYSHELPPSPPHGQRTNCPIIVLIPAALDGTARAWRSAYNVPRSYIIIALPGKDIAFCLALLLMGFTPVYPNG